jgi:hypothetical protein
MSAIAPQPCLPSSLRESLLEHADLVGSAGGGRVLGVPSAQVLAEQAGRA